MKEAEARVDKGYQRKMMKGKMKMGRKEKTER